MRLLVGYLAPSALDGMSDAATNGRQKPSSRFLMPSDWLQFRRYRQEKPGSVVVADASGRQYFAPVGFLEEPS